MTTFIRAIEFLGGDDFAGMRFHKFCVQNQEKKTGLYIGPYEEVEIEGRDICPYCGMPITGDSPDWEEANDSVW